MRKLICVSVVFILVMSMLPYGVFAASESKNTEIIWYDDGSYMEISVKESVTRVANTVSGSKTYTYYGANGGVEWKAVLSATFAYSGSWYTCTTASCNVTISESQWYVISNSTTRSSNNAITNLTMGRKLLGVTIDKPQYTIKLTCDSNGNLS